jgi:hypothetical protein
LTVGTWPDSTGGLWHTRRAKWGRLPTGFDRWDLADNDGWTVAHEAVQWGHLPEGFDRWDLADNDGWTVAHAAAYMGNLPADFDRWDLLKKEKQNIVKVTEKKNVKGLEL